MKQLNRILIANRGEIAVRIIRTCREMGIETVAAYTPDDEQGMHVGMADHAVALADNGYLDAAAIIAAAVSAGADAIHPGYGFLAEDPALSALCDEHQLVFVGPSAGTIAAMADKARAREIAVTKGIPVVPAIARDLDAATMSRFGDEVGWPLIVKAVAGGGGRGARVVRSAAGAHDALEAVTAEAERLFASSGVLVERYLESARHIEVQVIADSHGSVQALGARDCSVQRRHQKLLEEAPPRGLSPEIEQQLVRCATELARAVDYCGIGTVEYLAAGSEIYFLEMNTRIQVEHPVTEEVYGVDLVRVQLDVAAGGRLSGSLIDAEPRGHAIELRINAENPDADFAPSTGRIVGFELEQGPGVRLDRGYQPAQTVTGRYDGLIAKLIVWAPDRAIALDRLASAIDDLTLDGVHTTLELGRYIAGDEEFRNGPVDTRWLEDTLMPRFRERPAQPASAVDRAPGDEPDEAYGVWVAGRFYRLPVTGEADSDKLRTVAVRRGAGPGSAAVRRTGDLEIRSPMQGTVTAVLAEVSQRVTAGDPVVTIEAMKLENRVSAEFDAVVDEVLVSIGDVVLTGQTLVRLRAADST